MAGWCVDVKSFLAAKSKKKEHKRISYQVNGLNYWALSLEDRREQEVNFLNLLRLLDKPVEIVRAPMGGVLYNGMEYSQYIIYFTSEQDLEAPLRSAGYAPVRRDQPFSHSVKQEYEDHLELMDGHRIRVYNVHNFRHELNDIAWTVKLPVHESITRITPLDPSRGRGELNKLINVGVARLSDPTVQRDVQEAIDLRTSINNDETGMVEVSVHAVQYGVDVDGLREECKTMERACRLQQLRVSTVRGMQKRLLDGWGARLPVRRGRPQP